MTASKKLKRARYKLVEVIWPYCLVTPIFTLALPLRQISTVAIGLTAYERLAT